MQAASLTAERRRPVSSRRRRGSPAARPQGRATPRAYVTPNDRLLLSRTWRRCAVLLAVVLLAACAPPPVQRPREGAAPIAGGTPVRLESAPPPTLSAFSAPPTPTINALIEPLGSPSPRIGSSPGPSGSPGLSPIISGLRPAPGASLPAGDVVIGARISGSADLVDVTAFVDGDSVEIERLGRPCGSRLSALCARSTAAITRSGFRPGTTRISLAATVGSSPWAVAASRPARLPPRNRSSPPQPRRSSHVLRYRSQRGGPLWRCPGQAVPPAPAAASPTRPPAR